MEKMAATNILFDLDGTLWDGHQFYAKAISTKGINRDISLRKLADGKPAARLLRDAGISQTAFSKLVYSVDDHLLYPDVRDVLEELNTNGVTLGVVTSLPGWISTPILHTTNLSQYFRSYVDWNRCRSTKPSPEPLLLALRDLNILPDQNTWYVGDLISDYHSAKAAGISFAWASYGYSPVSIDDADKIISSFSEILKL